MGSWFKKLALGLDNNLLSPKKMGGAVREKPRGPRMRLVHVSLVGYS